MQPKAEEQNRGNQPTGGGTCFALVHSGFQPEEPLRKSQEVLETQISALVEESLRDPECLRRQTQQSSPTLSLSHDKAEVEPRSVGLPGKVTFAKPRSPIDPETANTPFSTSPTLSE